VRAVALAVLLLVTAPLAQAQTDGAVETHTAALAALAEQLDGILDHPRLNGVTVGVVVRSATTGEVLYDRGGHQRVLVGSNQKLLTSTAALAALGPDFRFHTSVLAEAAPRNGIIEGDLYLRGTGDPTLLPSRYDELATAVAARGITQVRGALVADDTWFDAVRLGTDWSWQDETFSYAAPISALSVSPDADFNAGSVQVRIAPGAAVGAPALVDLLPATRAVHVENRALTGPAGSPRRLSAMREHGADRIVVDGSVALDANPAQPLRSVGDPTAYAADIFLDALARHGITVRTPTRTGATPAHASELAALESMPLRDLLVPFLKLSNNQIAEILVKTLGRQDIGTGSWDAGLRVVLRYVAAEGVDPERVQLADGSGLSTSNLVAPDDLTAVLVGVQAEPWFEGWYAALPIAGEPGRMLGGTLAGRMLNTPAAGNVHAKTGSLTTASALSGYVSTATGERLAFSVVENGFIGAPPKEVEDAVAEALASWPRCLASCGESADAPGPGESVLSEGQP
jgi:D-alanyl-D-alanine carboxypeptidase/D-alanyl-D-alanine-endopeptidase (penicillin-binding protein 4)